MRLKIREVAQAKRISLRQLARRAGINYSQLQRAVNNRVTPTLPTLQKIAHVLGVTIDDLIENND